MADIKVAVFNASTAVNDADVEAAVPGLQTQVHDHFAPVWGMDADLVYVPRGQAPTPGAWWLGIFDTSDQAGALGYHDVSDEGLPLGKVFAADDLKFKLQWTVTASHELLEMLGDPEINLVVFVQPDATTGTLYAYEVCDACEDERFGYKIGGTLVSDFVFPSWFEPSRAPGSTQFDYQRQIQKPFDLLPGGYIGAFDVGSGTGWHQVYPPGQARSYQMRPRLGSRRERRRTPRDQWFKSEVQWR